MKPKKFLQANQTLKAPPGMESTVSELPVCGTRDTEGAPVIISCWELDEEDIKKLKKTKTLWLGVMGMVMPPVFFATENPFVPKIITNLKITKP